MSSSFPRTSSALRTFALVLFVLFSGPPAWALDPPKGPVILSITGRIQKPNKDGRADFDMAMLERLPQHSFTTRTPWHTGPTQFSGPLLREVLAAAQASGDKITATALNDYRTEIPFEDARQQQVIVALLMNGKPMPVRDKGPLFIIYPFDSHAALRSELYYNRSAWQLRRLVVE